MVFRVEADQIEALEDLDALATGHCAVEARYYERHFIATAVAGRSSLPPKVGEPACGPRPSADTPARGRPARDDRSFIPQSGGPGRSGTDRPVAA